MLLSPLALTQGKGDLYVGMKSFYVAPENESIFVWTAFVQEQNRSLWGAQLKALPSLKKSWFQAIFWMENNLGCKMSYFNL